MKKENILSAALAELKKTNRKLIIAGGAALAEKTYYFLKANDIKIDAIAVNKKYYKQDAVIGNKHIEILEDYVVKNPDCNVFVAFAGYNENTFSEISQYIHKIYCFDMIGMLVLDTLWVIDDEYLYMHQNDLNWLKSELSDKKSEIAFDDFINQKITGQYKKDYTDNQYFDEEIIKLQENEVFVDCGAYTGDTIERFINNLSAVKINKWKHIYGIEADVINYNVARERLNEFGGITLINKGVWDFTGICKFNQNGEMSSSSAIIDDGVYEIEVETIDSIVGNEKVTFIKMDIEGAELNALKGASNTIIKHKPKLAVCIYHKPEDLYEIPRYIKSLVPEYKFYVRNHSPSGIECVLYAILE